MTWLKHAQELPVAFSQVREDPLIDIDLIQKCAPAPHVLMIASGGCTAATLLSHCTMASLEVVDPNPAQLHLCTAKIKSVQFDPTTRQEIFTSTEQDIGQRYLNSIGIDPLQLGAYTGSLNQCGRYEQLFAQFRKELRDELEIDAETSLAQRLNVKNAHDLTQLQSCFEKVFNLDTLIALFGIEACNNARLPFHQHFYQQTRNCLDRELFSNNYFVEDLFDGSYATLPPWLSCPAQPASNQIMVTYTRAMMLDRLQELESNSYDIIHLSNILDWLDQHTAQQLLDEAARVLSKNGAIILRQLNSTLKIPQLSKHISVDEPMSHAYTAQDRSFFYRHIYVARPCSA